MARNNNYNVNSYRPRTENRHTKLKVAACMLALAAGVSHFDKPVHSSSSIEYEQAGIGTIEQVSKQVVAKAKRCVKEKKDTPGERACASASLEVGKLAIDACAGKKALFCDARSSRTVISTAADGEGVAQWQQRAKEITNPNSPLFQQLCASKTGERVLLSNGTIKIQKNCQGLCAYLQDAVWGYPSTGWETAADQWAAVKDTPEGHPGNRRPPVGALLFYDTGSYAGHVASYMGNDEVLSTDILDNGSTDVGHVYAVPASALEARGDAKGWHFIYEGWAEPLNKTSLEAELR